MVFKQCAIVTGVLAVAVALYLGNVGVARGIVAGVHGGIKFGHSVGVLSVPEHLVVGSPKAKVDGEVSPDLIAFAWTSINVVKRTLAQGTSLESARMAPMVPIGEPEPQSNEPFGAELEADVDASVIGIPSKIDNYVVEADLLLPSGVANLKEAKSVIITLHGGGHIMGTRSQEFGAAGLLVHHLRHKKVAALNLRQRLLPEFTVEQMITDITSVFRHLMDNYEFEANQIVLYGCSAGANMAIVSTLSLLGDGVTPGALLLSSPVDNHSMFDTENFPSLVDNEEVCYIAREFRQTIYDTMESVGPETAKQLSFLHRDLVGFPPTRLTLGATDVFLDHGKALAKKLEDTGITVDVDIPPGMWHCPFVGTGLVPESRQALERAARWLDRYV